ncbi:MAG: hypothetical protein EG828_04185 [Deltaproteobacteria bacterium]|nr:hypothetical protein [Deltaproteobacteria bacterium]
MRGSSNVRYSKEFRNEAVKLVIEGSMSVYEASCQLSLPKSTLENWVRAFKSVQENFVRVKYPRLCRGYLTRSVTYGNAVH